MMGTILFSLTLVLIIIWTMLGILYFCMQHVFPYDFAIKKKGESHKDTNRDEAVKEEDALKGQGVSEQTEFVLIGESHSTFSIIPQMPSISSSEKPERNSNNFAPQDSEKEEDMNGENSEVDVDLEMERVDENEVAREELNLPIESMSGEAKVPGQSILARDLTHLQKQTENCREADGEEVKETVRQLRDFELLDKYKENIAKTQGEQVSLSEKTRRAEEREEQSNQRIMPSFRNSTPPISDVSDTSSDGADEKPFSYYL